MSTNCLTRKALRGFDKVVGVLTWIGYAVITVVTVIFMIDVCGRVFANKPLNGSNELIELTMIILSSSIMYATWTKQHVKMDMLSPRLSRRARAILVRIGSLLEFGISVVIAYQSLIYGLEMLKKHEVTNVLSIPIGPFVLGLSIFFFMSCLASLLQVVNPQVSEEKSEGGSAI